MIELYHDVWYGRGETPERAQRRVTEWRNSPHYFEVLQELAQTSYERYYEERRAREQRIVADGVAQ